MSKYSEAVEAIRALILNPADSSTPHCIEEYNGGLENAIGVLESLDAA